MMDWSALSTATETGRKLRSGVNAPLSGVFDAFKTRQEAKQKFGTDVALIREKAKAESQYQSPKDRASTDLMTAQTNWMKGLSSDSTDMGEGMVLDSYSKSGPRFINAKSRLLQKEAGAQATALPKLDRAFDAVQQLKAQHATAFTPVSVPRGSNPLTGAFSKMSQGWGQGVSSMAGTNPQLNRYLANRGGFASLISKGGFLEAGVLTEGDINRMLKILPSEFSTKEESDIAWNEIENTLSSARKKYKLTQQSMFDGTGQSQQGQSNSETRQKYAEALAKYPTKKKAILAKYKQETGEDY